MVKYLYIFIILVLLISFIYAENSEKKIIVYYFHGYMRCSTCYKMEQYTKEGIEKNFSKELAIGKVIFKAVNYEVKENEYYIEKYQLYTKAVIVSFMKGNKEIKYKNLDKIWDLVSNKDKFIDYITKEVNEYLFE